MRILHTADWHLGRTLHGEDLTEAHQEFLDWLVDLVRSEHVDAVLVAGDVYDRAVPPLTAITQLSDALARLAQSCRVILTPGNHDSATRLGFGARLFRDCVVVAADPAACGRPVPLRGSDGVRALVYPIPYLDPDLTRQVLADPEGQRRDEDGIARLPRSHEAVVGAALRRVRADVVRRRRESAERLPVLVMVHAFLSGASTCDSERDVSVGGVQAVPARIFDTLGARGGDEDPDDAGRIDYVAAGHLHRPQDVHGARMPVRYSGSPLAFSFSEARDRKSVTLLDVGPAGVARSERIGTPVFRRLSALTGPIDQLLGPRYRDVRGDWTSLVVTDDARPEQMVARLRAAFPHALQVLHQPAHRASMAAGTAPVATARDPLAVATDFFERVGGRALDARESAAVRAVCESARGAGASR